MTIEQLYDIYQQYSSVVTDTRKLKKDDIFFALRGPNFNANTFVLTAIEKGAAYAISDDPGYAVHEKIIVVDDVLKTLQMLALYHRTQFSIPFVAITGSNGKTTTKELIHSVLSRKYKTYTTKGNLNNHIGIPLTILSVKPDAEMAIIEMGANHLKEIEEYCRYTLPTHGIITNCGKAHLEGFGSLEGVKKAKGELFDFLRTIENGTVFIMKDYSYLHEMSIGIKNIITYGTTDADITGIIKRNEPFLEVEMTGGTSIQTISTALVGSYNLPNVLVAVTAGKHFKVDEKDIQQGIETYQPSNSRSQMIEKDGNKIILDAYNANPSSMKVAIENFASLQAGNKVLMLGAMAELGDDSLLEHEQLIQLIHRYEWKDVVLVGGDFMNIPHPYTRLANSAEAKKWFQHQNLKNAYVLIKGSRSLKMEEALE